MKYYNYSRQIDTALTLIIGAYALYLFNLVSSNLGTEPQPAIDFWSYQHFTVGLITAYALYHFFSTPNKVVLSTMLVLGAWKVHQLIFGYGLFVQSLPNNYFDLLFGFFGAVICAYSVVYAVFKFPYGVICK